MATGLRASEAFQTVGQEYRLFQWEEIFGERSVLALAGSRQIIDIF
jgi:hypothetical protein